MHTNSIVNGTWSQAYVIPNRGQQVSYYYSGVGARGCRWRRCGYPGWIFEYCRRILRYGHTYVYIIIDPHRVTVFLPYPIGRFKSLRDSWLLTPRNLTLCSCSSNMTEITQTFDIHTCQSRHSYLSIQVFIPDNPYSNNNNIVVDYIRNAKSYA